MLAPGETALTRRHRSQYSEPWTTGPNRHEISQLEVAAGLISDAEVTTPPADRSSGGGPLEALEAVLLPLLERPPFVVAFSGGRDSSALLASAAYLARREGLEDPVALTAAWADQPSTDETEWQEAVIASLELANWERLSPGVDLDLLGPFARAALDRHGLFWPAPAYALIPLFRCAHSGTLVSGEGGDELFGSWPLSALRATLAAHRWPRPALWRGLAARCVPRVVRYGLAHRRARPYQSWLTPLAREAWREVIALEQANLPLTFPAYLAAQSASRDLRLTVETLRHFAETEGCGYSAPFLDRRFVTALGRFGGRAGIGDRAAVMTAVFGEILPREILRRAGKATFGEVFWGPQTQAFAEQWDGGGLPEDLVDAASLRDAWTSQLPVYASALAIHAAYLASRP